MITYSVIQRGSSGPPPKAPAETVRVDVARVRSGPGTEYELVGKLKRDRQVDVLEERAGWKRVRAGRTEGWVRNDLLALNSKEAVAPLRASDAATPHRPARCTRDLEETMSLLIHKIDRGTKNVYVNRMWYSLAFDQKQAVVVYARECLNIIRIRSASTGETIARWGMTGIKLYE